jgi:hypothetical protein
MAAANLDVHPAIVVGIVTLNATSLILLIAIEAEPVSTQRLVCHWHRDGDGRLVCAWEPDISFDPA